MPAFQVNRDLLPRLVGGDVQINFSHLKGPLAATTTSTKTWNNDDDALNGARLKR